MLKETLTFYRQLLPDIGFNINDNDELEKYTRNKSGVSFKPVMNDGLPVVLGTQEKLDSEDDGNIIYHPLTEDALKGESFTIKITKDQINAILRMRTINCLVGLGMALTEGGNKKVSPKLTKLLNQNPDFNTKTMGYMANILSKAKASVVSRHVMGIYLHSKNCKYEGHDVKRLAKVNSALYDALDAGDKTVWGVKDIPFKHQKAIKKLFETVLPGINDDNYTHGSNSKTAPYFDSLINAFLNVSYQLDSIENVSKDVFDDEFNVKPKYEWTDKLTQLAKLAMAIPPLRGNIGNDVVGSAAFDVPTSRTTRQETIKESAPRTSQPNSPSEPAKDSEHPFFSNNNTTPQHVTSPLAMPAAAPQQQSNSHPFFSNQSTTNTGMGLNQPGMGMPNGNAGNGGSLV